MPLRFRQTFTLFPGVRLNLAKGGASVSFGGPGASINFGRQGVRATVGIPGSGLSYSHRIAPGAKGAGPSPAAGPRPPFSPAGAPVYTPDSTMREIASAATERLTSRTLLPLRDTILAARRQRQQVLEDLAEARQEQRAQDRELDRRRRSLFRFFYRRRIGELQAAQPVTAAEISRLDAWAESTKIAVDFNAGEASQRAYGLLTRAFSLLERSASAWDVTADRQIDRRRERSAASVAINRKPVRIGFSSTDVVLFDGQAMQFQNANGDDLLLYPGLALVPRPDGIFALIDVAELNCSFAAIQFHEAEALPADAKVIGRAWARANKDGSPDLRFRDNHQIPVCQYGYLTFRTASGLAEDYLFSNAEAARIFWLAIEAYKKTLTE